MAAGKRTGTDEPLTEHDVAYRLDKAAIRILRILMDARQLGIADEVKTSRYLTNSLGALVAELQTWGVKPEPLRDLVKERSEDRYEVQRYDSHWGGWRGIAKAFDDDDPARFADLDEATRVARSYGRSQITQMVRVFDRAEGHTIRTWSSLSSG